MLQVATGTGWSLTDSHVHLDEPEYAQDLAEVLQASRQAGVRRWIVPGLTPARSVELPTLAAQHAGVFFAFGWHPWFVAESPESGLRCLQAALQARPTGLVAIGECGLDARIDVPIGWQWPVLEAQIRLACDWELPLILHSRGTHNELLSLLGRYRPKAGGCCMLMLAHSIRRCSFGSWVFPSGLVAPSPMSEPPRHERQWPDYLMKPCYWKPMARPFRSPVIKDSAMNPPGWRMCWACWPR